MAFFAAPGVAQLVLHGEWQGVIPVNHVFHVMKGNDGLGTPFSAADLLNACNRLSGAWQNVCSDLSNKMQYKKVTGRALDVADGAVAEMSTAIGGASAQEPVGPLLGPILQWRTGLAGRHNGRTFLPSVEEANMTNNGQISADKRAAIVTRGDAVRTFLGAATDATHPGPPIALYVLSTRPPLGETTRLPRLVVSVACPSYPGVQRRRQLLA
jgi:hypothetical protein